ncbi:MAG: choice-of-anchor J domain-containing protein, partial [Methylococcales bacterium]|nr:choice-of-anchor J domain-containing protein [Methylococcales bacterium]
SQTCSFSVTIDGSYGTTTIFTEDFEGGYAGWTMDGLWNAEAQGDTCGTTASPFPSPSNAAYYGDDAACNYDSGTNSGSLTMAAPVMITGTSPKLNYSSYSVTEGGSTYDKRMVDISTDGGTSWTQVGSFSDSSGTWLSAQVDLSAYSGQNALLRFRFDSIDSISNAFFGWMVDDIAITDQKSVPNTACVTATEGDSDCDSVTTLVTGGTSTAVGLSSVSAETSSTSALLLTFVAAFGMLGILLLRRRSAK